MRNSSRLQRPRLRLLLLLASATVLGACRSKSNYAPNSPVTGIDRPYPERPPGKVTDAGPGLLAGFIADVRADSERSELEPSYAVFPALSDGRDVGVSVNGMGMYLAQQTTRQLETEVPKARVLTGDQLLGEMRRNGIEARSLCSTDDIVEMAGGLGVSYVVYGKVNHTTENALEGQHSVALRWSCLRVEDRQLTALVDEPEIRGEAAAQFVGYLSRPSNWFVCGH